MTFSQTPSLTNCALCVNPFALYLSWWKQYPSASSLNSLYHTFYLTSHFFISDGKKKEKQNHTLSFLHSAQNITLSNLPLLNDNHKDEQNHQTEYKATLFFSIWSMRSSQCWSTHPIKPRWSLAFQPSPAAATFRKSRISKPREVFLSKSHGSRYNFHFNDELGGN